MLKKIRRARNYCLEVMERRNNGEAFNKAVELEEKLANQFGEILDSINTNEPLDLS